MNLHLDADPDEITWTSTIVVSTCLLAILISAFVLGFHVFGAVRDLVLSWA